MGPLGCDQLTSRGEMMLENAPGTCNNWRNQIISSPHSNTSVTGCFIRLDQPPARSTEIYGMLATRYFCVVTYYRPENVVATIRFLSHWGRMAKVIYYSMCRLLTKTSIKYYFYKKMARQWLTTQKLRNYSVGTLKSILRWWICRLMFEAWDPLSFIVHLQSKGWVSYLSTWLIFQSALILSHYLLSQTVVAEGNCRYLCII